jgi:hypothetical protein
MSIQSLITPAELIFPAPLSNQVSPFHASPNIISSLSEQIKEIQITADPVSMVDSILGEQQIVYLHSASFAHCFAPQIKRQAPVAQP